MNDGEFLIAEMTVEAPESCGVPGARSPLGAVFRGYVLAAGAASVALLLRLAFDPLWADRLAYAWFFLAVIVVARFAGTGPQLAAVGGGFLLANWFFIQPRGTFLIVSRLDQVNTLIYFAVCA